jgi:hypothetical protein
MVLRRLIRVVRVNAASVNKVCVYNAYLPTMGSENLTAHIVLRSQYLPAASVDILCHETEAFDRSKFAGKSYSDA